MGAGQLVVALRGLPEGPEFVIREHPVAAAFLADGLHVLRRAGVDHVALDRLGEQPADRRQGAVRHIRPALLVDLLEQVDHLAPGDRHNRPLAPAWVDVDLEAAVGPGFESRRAHHWDQGVTKNCPAPLPRAASSRPWDVARPKDPADAVRPVTD